MSEWIRCALLNSKPLQALSIYAVLFEEKEKKKNTKRSQPFTHHCRQFVSHAALDAHVYWAPRSLHFTLFFCFLFFFVKLLKKIGKEKRTIMLTPPCLPFPLLWRPRVAHSLTLSTPFPTPFRPQISKIDGPFVEGRKARLAKSGGGGGGSSRSRGSLKSPGSTSEGLITDAAQVYAMFPEFEKEM